MNARKSARKLLQGARIGLASIAMLQFSLMGPLAGGAQAQEESKSQTPIKHVIVIVGENRTFDHIFATYQPREGESVDNLLSKHIIKEDGSPGPNYAKAAQFAAKDNNFYTINPDNKTAYNKTNNKLQAP